MNAKQFQAAAFLLRECEVAELTGYAPGTIRKMIDNGVLHRVLPAGAVCAKFRKRQLAALCGLEMDAAAAQEFAKAAQMLSEKEVTRWTGYSGHTLERIVATGGLTFRRPAGAARGKFLKSEIAEMIGFPEMI